MLNAIMQTYMKLWNTILCNMLIFQVVPEFKQYNNQSSTFYTNNHQGKNNLMPPPSEFRIPEEPHDFALSTCQE